MRTKKIPSSEKLQITNKLIILIIYMIVSFNKLEKKNKIFLFFFFKFSIKYNIKIYKFNL